MSEEKQPNWLLAVLMVVGLIGALIALALPFLRGLGGLILLASWATISSSASYSWYGGRGAGVWIRLSLALVVLMIAAITLPTSLRIFLLSLAAVEVVLACWSLRRPKADRAGNR